MAGSLATSGERRLRGTRFLPLWPLLVFVVLALAAGVAYERAAAGWVYCQSSAYSLACLHQIQYVQLLGALWVAAAAAVGVLVVLSRASGGRFARWAPPPGAWLSFGLFLVAWAGFGILAAEAQSAGYVPAGTGESFLHVYVIASLLQVGGIFLRPHPGGIVSNTAVVLASFHGVVATVIGLAYAVGLVFPAVTST